MILLDSYSEDNYGLYLSLINGLNTKVGQSFYGGGTVEKATFYLQKTGSPTGNATAVLYAHTGTFGTSGTPTGTALATSETLDVTTLTSTITLTDLIFTTPYKTTEGTPYFIVFEHPSGSSGNSVGVGYDNSSSTHEGNLANYFIGSWNAGSTDTIFYIYVSERYIPASGTGTIKDTGFTKTVILKTDIIAS